MKHRSAFLSLLLMLPAAAMAQTAPATNPTATSAEVQDLIAKAKAMPARPVIVLPIAGTGPLRANMEYRMGQATASVHDVEGELDYVIDGSGAFTYGGTLVGQSRTNPTNQSGTGIEGGTTIRIAKGDWLIVPAGTPHLTVPDAGTAVIYMTFHTPPAAPPQ